jgi:hypothetical protein
MGDLRLYRHVPNATTLEVGLAEEEAMTATMQEQSSARTTDRDGWAARVLVPEMWATLSIVAMWLAVLFVGVFGSDMSFHGVDGSFTVMPSVVGVALFAAIGTGSIAKRVFGRPSSR